MQYLDNFMHETIKVACNGKFVFVSFLSVSINFTFLILVYHTIHVNKTSVPKYYL